MVKAIFYSILLFCNLTFANEVFVGAEVDRDEMRPGDTFTLSVTVQSEGGVEVQPEWPNLTGFQAINTWTGTQIQSVFENNKFITKRKQMYHLQLQALEEGQFTIPPVKVYVDGTMMATKSIPIVVSQNVQPNTQQNAGSNSPFDDSDPFGGGGIDDIFNQMLQNRLRGRAQPRAAEGQDINAPHLNANEPLFLDAEVDKKKVYEGQQLTVSFYLYTKVSISDIDTLKYPTLEGFWKEDIEVATRLNFKPLRVNGVPYQRALLASYALFPIKSGKAQIDSYKAKLTTLNFNPFGRQSSKSVTKLSKPINITVLPLPAENKPQVFTGGVGDYIIKTDVDNQSPERNQPITLRIRLEGTGNAKLIELPSLDMPPSLEVYDSQSESAYYPTGKSFKEFKVLLIPREEGEVEVPSVPVSFFSATKNEYYTLSSEAMLINVQPGQAAEGGDSVENQITQGSPQNIKRLPPVYTKYINSTQLAGSGRIFLWSGLYAASLLALFGLAFIEFGKKEKREKLRTLVQNRISKIESLHSKSDYTNAASETVNLIYFTLGELSEIGGGSEELEKMLKKAPPSFRTEYQDELIKLMKNFEAIAFAPKEISEKLSEKKVFSQNLKAVKNILIQATKLDFTDGK